MNRHTLRVLEFEHVRALVRDRCLTYEGAKAVRAARLLTDENELALELERVGAVRRCIESPVRLPAVDFPSITDPLARLAKEGVVLEPEELASIGTFTRSVGLLGDYLGQASREAGVSLEVLGASAEFPDVRPIATRLLAYLDPDGSIREREIPELRALRAEVNRAQQELQRVAVSLMGQDELRRYWSAEVPTQREGRTVLPLKADHRGKVRGIVHEVSATGATLFVEPEELVLRNNAVVEAEHRYRAELLRILRELSSFCRAHREEIARSVERCVSFDLIYARARYGVDTRAVRASSSGDALELVGAKHPLLGESAVPISVSIPAGKRVLIITGPNTGGKTVTLKTIGLLALMNQFALEIPAAPGSALPVFAGVYADIGDEQSIEQSLSTFSGHMKNIARILNHADERCLVLLDELGSGTDPEEGGALAMAILDQLLERGPYTVVTTHHGRLKHYGFTRPEATNASVEFDAASLRPTYHVIPGVPGSSHAIEVAAHMGVRRSVTTAARTYLSGEEYDTGRMIRNLTDREQELHREREELRLARRKTEDARELLEQQEGRLRSREVELRAGRLAELDRWASDTRSRLENLVREIREGELTREKTQAVKQFIADVGAELARERTVGDGMADDGVASKSGGHRQLQIGSGMRVRVRATGAEGVVYRRGKGSTWVVQIGTVRLPVETGELVPLGDSGAPEAVSYDVSYARGGVGSAGRAALEVDLRGMRLEEALEAVRRQIDAAVLSGLREFGIIHGMGEGVLQQGVRDLLRDHPAVVGFDYARPEEGGYGKTNVTLQG